MNYGEILTEAWQTVWKHKILWLFGILAGCAGQVGSNGGQINFRMDSRRPAPPQIEHFFNQIAPWQVGIFLMLLAGIIILLVALSMVLSSIGRAGLVKGTLMSAERTEALSWGEVWESSKPYIGRLVGLNILIGLALGAAVFAMVAAMMLVTVFTLGIGLLCLLPFVFVLIPLFWGVSVFVEQANVALVVDDLSISEAVRAGWSVCRENPGEIIVMGLLLVLGGGIIALLIAAPMGLALAPIIGGLLAGGERALGGGLVIGGLCLAAYLPVLLVLSGILRAYIISAWTLTYTALRGAPPAGAVSIQESLPSGF